MLEVADDQGVVGRNEEEVDDKIGGEGGRQRSPHAANHRGHHDRHEVEQHYVGQAQRPANRDQSDSEQHQTAGPASETGPDTRAR